MPKRHMPWGWLLVAVLSASSAYGCRVERSRPSGDDVHEDGYAEPSSASFHGTALVAGAYPLGGCRECHGDDYAGGSVGVSCVTGGCHAAGVEACDTCHASPPATGAHAGHAFTCAECHPARADARSAGHPDALVDVRFAALARASGALPSFDASTGTCTNVYCHLGQTAVWKADSPLGCGDCHGDPPSGHAQFATTGSDCTTCHGSHSTHVNGTLDVAPLGCDGCHGHGPLGAPPPALVSSGAADAHARHLDPGLEDRMGRVARCDDCHVVPDSVAALGHVDDTAPADIALHAGGTYDPVAQRCAVGCHWAPWSSAPGPVWSDDSGAPRACDACHAFPPTLTRAGAPHPPAGADLGECTVCHAFDPSTHVDGKVDFAW